MSTNIGDVGVTDKDIGSSSSARSIGHSSKRLITFALIFFTVAAIVLGTVATLNYWLDPLTYSRSAQRTAAEAWASGHNVAMLDSNVDWRELRREHIKRMKETPDVVIFGGSRWQEASSEVLPGKRVYTAFVSNDHFEDMLAISELLYEANRLPKTLILSARFSTFEYLGHREAWWWKSFWPEYDAMSKRLGIPTYSRWQMLQFGKWFHLLSVDLLYQRLKAYLSYPLIWKSTDELTDPVLDIVAADGAFRFSEKNLQAITLASAEKEALNRVAVDRDRSPQINQSLLDHLEKLLVFLQNKGVTVAFLQTPFHPAFFNAIKGSPYYDSIMRIESEINRIAKKRDVFVGGGFDPVKQGCEAADFRDFNHSRMQCLKRIIVQVPYL